MSLPNPGMSFTPFDPLAASELNDMVENIESLSTGSGFVLDNNTIPANALTTTAIKLGYTELTSNFGPVSTSTSDVDITGLAVTVTIPDGGRDLLLIAKGSAYIQSGGIGTVYGVGKIKEGSTVLDSTSIPPAVATFPYGWEVSTRVSAPSAGSHTYKVAFAQNSTGPTFTIGASSVAKTSIIGLLI